MKLLGKEFERSQRKGMWFLKPASIRIPSSEPFTNIRALRMRRTDWKSSLNYEPFECETESRTRNKSRTLTPVQTVHFVFGSDYPSKLMRSSLGTNKKFLTRVSNHYIESGCAWIYKTVFITLLRLRIKLTTRCETKRY